MIAKGTVVNAKTGETLPGATVAIYKSVQCVTLPCTPILIGGTSTDLNGNFEINVDAGQYVQISSVGYGTNVPMFINGVAQTVKLEPTTINNPTATATAKRTYNKYYVAAAVAVVLLLIWYKA